MDRLVRDEAEIAGVAFGPGRLLGVGLASGDGNIVDIPAKQLRRTDTFPEREHNRWMVKVVIEPDLLPPEAPRKPAAPMAPETEDAPGRSPGTWIGVALVVLIVVVLALTRLL